MAFTRRRVPTFGREDRASGLRVLLKGQSIFIRLVAFLAAAGIFLLIVALTHKRSATDVTPKDSVALSRKPQ
jgi:hypothetical protein